MRWPRSAGFEFASPACDFRAVLALKKALRGQDQHRRGRNQRQTIGMLGSPAKHHASVRRAWCRRRTAAQPSKVPIRIRLAGITLLSRISAALAFGGLRRARMAGDEGADKIDAAVSLTASIWSGSTGLALTATRRRLARRTSW